LKKYFDRISLNNSKIYQHNIIAILLLSIGIFFLCIPISNIIKIGAVLTTLGFFLAVLKTENKINDQTKEIPIMFIMIIWTLIVYFIIVITNMTVEILFILVLIGLLVIYEYTSKVISLLQKNRLHFAIFIYLIIVVMILITKIISMSTM